MLVRGIADFSRGLVPRFFCVWAVASWPNVTPDLPVRLFSRRALLPNRILVYAIYLQGDHHAFT